MSYLPARTRTVNVTGSVTLARGSIPLLESGESALPQIRADLEADAETPVHVVSLIDNQGELPLLSAELAVCGIEPDSLPSVWPPFTIRYGHPVLHGTHADLTWWPIEAFGNGTTQDVITGQFLTNKGINMQRGGYDLDGLTENLRLLMKTPREQKLIVYVHCTLGADRTGAAMFAYLVKVLGHSSAEALRMVETVTPPNSDYQRLIRAYTDFLVV